MRNFKSSEYLGVILKLEGYKGLINLITFNFLPPKPCSRNLGSVLALWVPIQAELPMPWEQCETPRLSISMTSSGPYEDMPSSPGA